MAAPAGDSGSSSRTDSVIRSTVSNEIDRTQTSHQKHTHAHAHTHTHTHRQSISILTLSIHGLWKSPQYKDKR